MVFAYKDNVFSWFTHDGIYPISELEGLIITEFGYNLVYIINGKLKTYDINRYEHTIYPHSNYSSAIKLISTDDYLIIIFDTYFIRTNLHGVYIRYNIPKVDKILSITDEFIYYQIGIEIFYYVTNPNKLSQYDKMPVKMLDNVKHIWSSGPGIFEYLKNDKLYTYGDSSVEISNICYSIYYMNDHTIINHHYNSSSTIICPNNNIIKVLNLRAYSNIESTNLAVVITFKDGTQKSYDTGHFVWQSGVLFDGELYQINLLKSARNI
jgi:hypothetical protein